MQPTHTIEDIEQKLATLRTRWVSEIPNRWIIKRQAKLLKIALEMKLNKLSPQQTMV